MSTPRSLARAAARTNRPTYRVSIRRIAEAWPGCAWATTLFLDGGSVAVVRSPSWAVAMSWACVALRFPEDFMSYTADGLRP